MLFKGKLELLVDHLRIEDKEFVFKAPENEIDKRKMQEI